MSESVEAGRRVRLPARGRAPDRGLRQRRQAGGGQRLHATRDEILFKRPLMKEQVSGGRWLAMALGLFGSYGRHDTVDVHFQLGGKPKAISEPERSCPSSVTGLGDHGRLAGAETGQVGDPVAVLARGAQHAAGDAERFSQNCRSCSQVKPMPPNTCSAEAVVVPRRNRRREHSPSPRPSAATWARRPLPKPRSRPASETPRRPTASPRSGARPPGRSRSRGRIACARARTPRPSPSPSGRFRPVRPRSRHPAGRGRRRRRRASARRPPPLRWRTGGGRRSSPPPRSPARPRAPAAPLAVDS